MLAYEDIYVLQARHLVDCFNEYLTRLSNDWFASYNQEDQEWITHQAFYIWANCMNASVVRPEYQMLYPFTLELCTYAANHHVIEDIKEHDSSAPLPYKLFIYAIACGIELTELFHKFVPEHQRDDVREMRHYIDQLDTIITQPRFQEIAKMRKNLYYELSNGSELKKHIDCHIYRGYKQALQLLQREV